MRRILTPMLTVKGSIALAMVAMLVAGGVIYATQLTFNVNITGNVNLIVTGDPIQIFSGDGVTRINSGDALDFGTAAVDFFGRGPVPIRGPFTVKNVSNGPVQVIVTGDGVDNIVPLWGPTIDSLEPWPDNTFTLAAPGMTGDTMMGYLGLSFPMPTTGSKQTTIIFRATETVPIQPPSGMVSWWPGDGNAQDIVGGNHGTLTGDFAQGMVGQAFSFDGVDDYISIGDKPSLEGMREITIDAWVKSTAGGTVVSKFNHNSGPAGDPQDDSYDLFFTTAYILWQLETTGDSGVNHNILSASANIADGSWHLLTVTYDFAAMRIWVDGEFVSGKGASGAVVTSPTSLDIGRTLRKGNPTEFFSGIIDEVEIFNRALRHDQIKAIYDAGRAGKIRP